ncbi:hypothetical protein VTO73DRAFT_14167 [Trametes versicolor]
MYTTMNFAKPAKTRKTGKCATLTCKRTNISEKCRHGICAPCCRLDPRPCGYISHNRNRHNQPLQPTQQPTAAPWELNRPLPTVPYDPPPPSPLPSPTQPDSPPSYAHFEPVGQSQPTNRVLRVPMDQAFEAAWDKAKAERVKALEGGDLLRQNMAALAHACVLMFWPVDGQPPIKYRQQAIPTWPTLSLAQQAVVLELFKIQPTSLLEMFNVRKRQWEAMLASASIPLVTDQVVLLRPYGVVSCPGLEDAICEAGGEAPKDPLGISNTPVAPLGAVHVTVVAPKDARGSKRRSAPDVSTQPCPPTSLALLDALLSPTIDETSVTPAHSSVVHVHATAAPTHAPGLLGLPDAFLSPAVDSAVDATSVTPTFLSPAFNATSVTPALPVVPPLSGPVASGPVASGPVHSGPVPSGPVHSGPVPSGPVPSGLITSLPLSLSSSHPSMILIPPSLSSALPPHTSSDQLVADLRPLELLPYAHSLGLSSTDVVPPLVHKLFASLVCPDPKFNHDVLWQLGFVWVPFGSAWPNGMFAMFARDIAKGFELITPMKTRTRPKAADFERIFPGAKYVQSTFYTNWAAWRNSTQAERDALLNSGRTTAGLWGVCRKSMSGWKSGL